MAWLGDSAAARLFVIWLAVFADVPPNATGQSLAGSGSTDSPASATSTGQFAGDTTSFGSAYSDDDVFCTETGLSQCRQTRLPSIFQEPDVCQYDQDASPGGALVAGMFDLHSMFSGRTYSCPPASFENWDAVISTQAFFYAHGQAMRDLMRSSPRRVRTIEKYFNATLQQLMGLRVRDTCTSPLLSTVHALSLTTGALLETDTETTCAPRVQIVIGPAGSNQVASISQILSSKSIPQISFWASSMAFDDTESYPYLFRTVPSDRHQIRGLADVIERFGWTYVALVASSDNLYGQRGLEGLRSESVSRKTFCIAQEHSISSAYPLHMESVIGLLKSDANIRVIVLFALLDDARSFILTAMEQNYTDILLLGSEDWVNRLDFNEVTLGPGTIPPVLGLSPRPLQTRLMEQATDTLKEIFQDPVRLKPYWRKNPWLKTFLETTFRCSLDVNSTQQCRRRQGNPTPCRESDIFLTDVPSLLPVQPLIQAVLLAMSAIFGSITTASQRAPSSRANGGVAPTKCIQTGGQEVRCVLSNLAVPCDDVAAIVPDKYKGYSFDNSTGYTESCLLFDPCTQSALPFYYVVNLQRGADDTYSMVKVGNWSGFSNKSGERLTLPDSSSLDWSVDGLRSAAANTSAYPRSVCHSDCQPGYYRVITNSLQPCCWTCEACHNRSVSSGNNSDSCRRCEPGMEPNAEQSSCALISGQYIGLSDSLGTFVLVEASAGILLLVLTLVVIWRHRKEPRIKACDIHLSTVMLVAGMLAFLSSVVALLEPSDGQCRLLLLFSTPWTLVCSATVLAKTNRLHQLFNATVVGQLKLLSTPVQLLLVFALAMVGELIGILAVATSAPDVQRLVVNQDTVQLVCRSTKFTPWYGSIVAYNILLIAVCLAVGFRVRKLPERYNEARLIFMASFCTFIVWLGFGPAFFITTGTLQPFIIALSSSAQIWSMWACLFAPRLYQVLRPGSKSKKGRPSRSSLQHSSTFEHSTRRANRVLERKASEQSRCHNLQPLPVGRSDTMCSEVEYSLNDDTPTPKVSVVSAQAFLPVHEPGESSTDSESSVAADSGVVISNSPLPSGPSPVSEVSEVMMV